LSAMPNHYGDLPHTTPIAELSRVSI